MSDGTIITALAAAATTAATNPELVKDLSVALAMPAFQKAGKALGDLVDIVGWPPSRAAIFLRDNLKRYQSRLDSVPDDKLVAPAREIAIPLLERLGYVTDVDLAERMAALLATASSTERAGTVHPSFVHALDSMVPDEIKVLQRLEWDTCFSDVYLRDLAGNAGLARKSTFNVREEFLLGLAFPEQLGAYLENLERLGILQIHRDQQLTGAALRKLASLDARLTDEVHDGQLRMCTVELRHGFISLTRFGASFVEATDVKARA